MLRGRRERKYTPVARRCAALERAKGKVTSDNGRVCAKRAGLCGDSGHVHTNRGCGRWRRWRPKRRRVREGLFISCFRPVFSAAPSKFSDVGAVLLVHVKRQRALRAHVRPKTSHCCMRERRARSVHRYCTLTGRASTKRPVMRPAGPACQTCCRAALPGFRVEVHLASSHR